MRISLAKPPRQRRSKPLSIEAADGEGFCFRFRTPRSTSGSRTALRPNFIARRRQSNLIVLVRNKQPPSPAHDGKGVGEVIDESSDGRQHAPGCREDQVDGALWTAREATLEAERQAARDARYAARKAQKRKGR